MVAIPGRYHTNQQSIEMQLMRRFIENMNIKSLVNACIFSSEHLSIFNSLLVTRYGDTANEALCWTFCLGNGFVEGSIFIIKLEVLIVGFTYHSN